MNKFIIRLTIATSLLVGIAGCASIQEAMMGQGDAQVLLDEGMKSLQEGNLPAASEQFEKGFKENPTAVDLGVARAYTQMLQGDFKGADATLASLSEHASPEQVKGLKLRRALVKVNQRDHESIKEAKVLATESGLGPGLLLAAELYMMEFDDETARSLLQQAKDQGGASAGTASRYLALMNSDDQNVQGMTEAYALWSTGMRDDACSSAEDMIKDYPDGAERETELLLWAGRAVTSGRPNVAKRMLEAITFPPEGQAWRRVATQAMVEIALGEVEAGTTKFAALRDAVRTGNVPKDGFEDAIATACAVSKDPEVAKQLVVGLESAAAARCLYHAGAIAEAKGQAPPGSLKLFLEAK